MKDKKLFAIGDIHGCFEQLQLLVEQLPLDENSELVFLGDYVDRGPYSKQVIDYIIELKSKYNVTCLRGNHEQMMLDFLDNPASINACLFIMNGGSATLASYEVELGQYSIPDDHMIFLRNLKLYHETDQYFFVHAGVPDIELSQIDESKHKNDMLWIRESFLENDRRWEKIIVHGHTVFDTVQIEENRISLDTGCVYNQSLSAIELYSGTIYSSRFTKRFLLHI
ncbi:MAG: metallophosphoesterase family protein [Bdellovibrionales bacterium]